MKGFLLDENLPSHLQFKPQLPVFPFSKVGQHPSDAKIWNFAKQHELAIVSKDADFSDRIILQSDYTLTLSSLDFLSSLQFKSRLFLRSFVPFCG